MIAIELLKELGWERQELYPPGSSKATGYEYMYEKNGKRIRVNETTHQIFTYDGGETRVIENEKELFEYGNR
jgi:hypothetical protein